MRQYLSSPKSKAPLQSSRQFVSVRLLVWLSLLLSAFPSLLHLPFWVAAIALLASCIGFLAGASTNNEERRVRVKITVKCIVPALLLGTGIGVWLSFDSWFSGDAILSFFIIVVCLKWAEAGTRQEYLLLVFGGVILAALGALYWQTLLSLAHLFGVVMLLIVALVAIQGSALGAVQSHSLARPPPLEWWPILRRSGALLLPALPIMALLFLTFPRIPGPLWDIGLAFGLPVKALLEEGNREFGKAKTMQANGIQRASQEPGNVLVAEFHGAVPGKSRLYWRGPVFWDYDGRQWQLADDWNNRARLLKHAIRSREQLDRETHYRNKPVHYSLRVMPNGGRWLYGLDLPGTGAPESFISSDFQLLSIRTLKDHEPKLEMVAYLEYAVGAALSDEARARALAWPAGSNPELLALGKKLKAEYRQSAKIQAEALRYLARGEYRFEASPTSMESLAEVLNTAEVVDLSRLDRFFFQQKTGGAEPLASSFAMLMRAAGIPARLVTGYRGGTVVALTDFVIVKQSHAHAWVETWQDGSGWQRVDPKDVVLPPHVSEQSEAIQAALKPELSLRMAPGKAVDSSASNRDGRENDQQNVDLPTTLSADWFAKMAGVLRGLQKWIVDFNPDRQHEILADEGGDARSWADLLMWGALGLMALLLFYVAIHLALFWGRKYWRSRHESEAEIQIWSHFCARMETLGFAKQVHECPRAYQRRIAREQPELSAPTADITARYIAIRYGAAPSADALHALRLQVKRFVSM